MELFVFVATSDTIPATTPSFSESWTHTRTFKVCLFSSRFTMTKFLIWVFVSHANFLASEGLKKLILDKEKLKSERDQLLAKRDKIDARLSVLEAQAAKAGELDARLQQSKQEVMSLSQ